MTEEAKSQGGWMVDDASALWEWGTGGPERRLAVLDETKAEDEALIRSAPMMRWGIERFLEHGDPEILRSVLAYSYSTEGVRRKAWLKKEAA